MREVTYPCDGPENYCPYVGTYGGSESHMCYDCCGVGADETSPDSGCDEEEVE